MVTLLLLLLGLAMQIHLPMRIIRICRNYAHIYAAHMSYSVTAWPSLVTKAIVLIALYAKGIFIVFILFIYFVKRMKH